MECHAVSRIWKIVKLRQEGRPLRLIARDLGISLSTVNRTLRQVFGPSPSGDKGAQAFDPGQLDRLHPDRIVAQA